ncbi:DegT/DnrJ/EryC1/StrS family aminotransferase [Pseudomonas guineae]|uniref:DegT/DnrJ/EryC1/StrS family aminotransferase n=1 Tax=Pseudomonas guineae TaxID=425504 RepID=UPI003D0390E5
MREHEVKADIPHSSPWISEDDLAAVDNVLRSGMIASGRTVYEFEKACASYLGGKHTELTSSGQAALLRALQLLNLKPSASVIIPTYVCSSVEAAVVSAGLRPVFCDIGEAWCMTAQTVAKVFDSGVAAIIAVHLFGIKVDVGSLTVFGVPVIEDCAQCFDDDVGRAGDLSVYSFHATKCLTCAEGGLIVIPEASSVHIGVVASANAFRMSDLQAALGLSQLSRYGQMQTRRQVIARTYFSTLSPHLLTRLQLIKQASMFFRFPLFFSEGFDQAAPLFWKRGVLVRRGVDTLLHRQRGFDDSLFPNAITAFNNTVSIPCYPAMSDFDVDRVVSSVESVLNEL